MKFKDHPNFPKEKETTTGNKYLNEDNQIFNQARKEIGELSAELLDVDKITNILCGSVIIGRGITEKLSAPNATLRRYAQVIVKAFKEGELSKKVLDNECKSIDIATEEEVDDNMNTYEHIEHCGDA